MEKEVEQALRELHEYVAGKDWEEEIGGAKAEFYAWVGAPLSGESIEELRLSSFIEWFIFDRQRGEARRTPVEEYMRLHADDLSGPRLEVLRGFTRTVHSIFMILKRQPGVVVLKDLYTGVKYKEARRVPVTLGETDMAELRLAPVGGGWYAADALCFHPFAARKQILRMLEAARKEGKPVDQVLIDLMAMNTRYERFPKTAKRNAYEGYGTLAQIPGIKR